MPDAVSGAQLAHCMSLPPKQAIAYLQAKGYAISWDWEEVWQQAQAKAFTVAKVMRLDLLQDIREAVEAALKEGQTLAAFTKVLAPTLKAKGWWGRQEHIDPDSGEITQVQLGSAWRLRTIYRTNLQTAYMAGRYAEQLSNAENRPFWKYVAVLDKHTRASHRAMNGKVFRHDDPFWQSFYPPNGWGCRCRVTTLSAGQVERQGLVVDASAGKLGTVQKVVSQKTGEVRDVATFTTVDPLTRKRIVVSPDVGWSYNPGAASWQPELGSYGGSLADLARHELKGRP